MDENIFRIVVTVAVLLACLAFVVQAGIMLALYRVARKTQESAERFTAKVEPMIGTASPVVEQAGRTLALTGKLIEKLPALVDRMGPAIDAAAPVIKKTGPLLEEARTAVGKAGRLVDRATEIAGTTNGVISDARPQLKQISVEAVEVARLARERVEQMGDLLQDAGEKAKARLDQIDEGVDNTIEHVEQVGGAVKRAVMKPVREANGVAAGISAAVATLVRGHRKSRVDSATQDEEMFI